MIIGLSGKARVGKGEVACRLVSGHGFIEVAFADALKKACRDIFGLTWGQLYGADKDLTDSFWEDTPRNILQKVGTECLRRGYRDDVWVKALERDVQANPHVDFVVSDCRFANELEAVKSWGGKLVRIERPDAPRITTPEHASETSLDNWRGWDYTLVNDGTLDVLRSRVDLMLGDFRK